MAVGDDAAAAGFPLVPGTGEDGKVKHGAREINRTRDLVAQVKDLILATWPVNRGGTGGTTKSTARSGLGFTSGTAAPNNANGENGDWYARIV